MGYMPPHDPTRDASVTWIRAKVVAVTPQQAGKQPRVTLDVLEVTKPATAVGWVTPMGFGPPPVPSPMPARIEVVVHATRSTGQEAFYIQRAALPDEAERLEALARRTVNVPMEGETIQTWLNEIAPGTWAFSPDEPRWRTYVPPSPEAQPRSWWARVRRKLGLG
jgi:hypothetical protein